MFLHVQWMANLPFVACLQNTSDAPNKENTFERQTGISDLALWSCSIACSCLLSRGNTTLVMERLSFVMIICSICLIYDISMKFPTQFVVCMVPNLVEIREGTWLSKIQVMLGTFHTYFCLARVVWLVSYWYQCHLLDRR